MKCGKAIGTVMCLAMLAGVCGCGMFNDKSEAKAEAIIKPAPFVPEGTTAFERAIDYDRQEEYALAKAEYVAAMGQDPKDSRPHVNLGLMYQKQGKEDLAMLSWRNAIAVNPDDAKAYNLMGNVYMKREQYGRASACYERAVKADPEYADAHWNLATASRHMGDEETAATSYGRFVAAASSADSQDLKAADQFLVAYREKGHKVEKARVPVDESMLADATTPDETSTAAAESPEATAEAMARLYDNWELENADTAPAETAATGTAAEAVEPEADEPEAEEPDAEEMTAPDEMDADEMIDEEVEEAAPVDEKAENIEAPAGTDRPEVTVAQEQPPAETIPDKGMTAEDRAVMEELDRAWRERDAQAQAEE